MVTSKEPAAKMILLMMLSQMAMFHVNPNQLRTTACTTPQHSQQMANTKLNCSVLKGEIAKVLN